MVSATDAKQIIQLAVDANIKVFCDGGWGVDALIGHETREHNDIDLFVEKQNYQKFIQILKSNLFFEVEMEYTTNGHTVWKDNNERIIDLHCFEYTESHDILYEGETFPGKTFSGEGIIDEMTVSCIEPYSQIMFHLGYEHDENDIHDVQVLCEKFKIDIPKEYQ